ncbi:Scr1 family TA system antitoxin-like transcriptional regulator [Nocardia asteroides]|uniref:Scr1 family TA system antitoxin-like transcriptional regulator n=1 Tax=Nocardia asteroides TaxID=1824 RepID=UPI0033DB0291
MSYSSWYDVAADGLETLQRSLIDIEAETKHQRTYNPDVIPGLVQTRDYARAILTKCSAVLELPDDSEATAGVRLQRQALLDAPGHLFAAPVSSACRPRCARSCGARRPQGGLGAARSRAALPVVRRVRGCGGPGIRSSRSSAAGTGRAAEHGGQTILDRDCPTARVAAPVQLHDRARRT